MPFDDLFACLCFYQKNHPLKSDTVTVECGDRLNDWIRTVYGVISESVFVPCHSKCLCTALVRKNWFSINKQTVVPLLSYLLGVREPLKIQYTIQNNHGESAFAGTQTSILNRFAKLALTVFCFDIIRYGV